MLNEVFSCKQCSTRKTQTTLTSENFSSLRFSCSASNSKRSVVNELKEAWRLDRPPADALFSTHLPSGYDREKGGHGAAVRNSKSDSQTPSISPSK